MLKRMQYRMDRCINRIHSIYNPRDIGVISCDVCRRSSTRNTEDSDRTLLPIGQQTMGNSC